jgi:hypothetical protein
MSIALAKTEAAVHVRCNRLLDDDARRNRFPEGQARSPTSVRELEGTSRGPSSESTVCAREVWRERTRRARCENPPIRKHAWDASLPVESLSELTRQPRLRSRARKSSNGLPLTGGNRAPRSIDLGGQ